MTSGYLTLIPLGRESSASFQAALWEEDERVWDVEESLRQAKQAHGVFFDQPYEFVLHGDSLDEVSDVRVYINDVDTPALYQQGRLRFFVQEGLQGRVFLDCYGYVTVRLTLLFQNGETQNLCTGYMPVLVRKGALNDSVCAMMRYVAEHEESLLYQGETKPRAFVDIKEKGSARLEAKLQLAARIAECYEANYGYFKSNHRTHIEKAAAVEYVERLPLITPDALRYIANHPQYLQAAHAPQGIRIAKRTYQPSKALSLRNVSTADIYENRVVLGFLRYMLDELRELRAHCERLLELLSFQTLPAMEYVDSSRYLFAESRQVLADGEKQLSQLSDTYARLWRMYHDALSIAGEKLTAPPLPTPLFLSLPAYHQLFEGMYQWFHYGVYDFAKERFLLSFVKASALYESYLLVKLVAYVQTRGYRLIEKKRCHYPVAKSWLYQNTRCANTYRFSDGQRELTLYYQPVIFDSDQSGVNAIGLYRNNSIASGESEWGAHYYTPDYLLKLEDAQGARYLILDAKFSSLASVRKYHLRNLAFKYLFSISPITPRDQLAGMCILYGKCQQGEESVSAYDCQIEGHVITPFAQLMPLMEGVDDEAHAHRLDALLQMLWRG